MTPTPARIEAMGPDEQGYDPRDFAEPDIDEQAAWLLLDRFAGRDDLFLEANAAGVRWTRAAVNVALVLSHVHGERRIGFGVIPDRPSAVAIDFDGKGRPDGAGEAFTSARAVVSVFDGLRIPTLVERSRSAEGFHVWVLVDPGEPATLKEARRVLALALRAAGLPDDGDEGKGHPGIFPHPPGSKGVGRSPFLPWCGLTNGKPGGLFVNYLGEVLEDQLGALRDAGRVTRSALIVAVESLARRFPDPPAASVRPSGRRSSRATSCAQDSSGISAWARKALEAEVEAVANAPKGTRNETLNRAAFNLAQIVAGGELVHQVVHDALFAAAEAYVADKGEAAAEATIASGMAAGAREPREAEPPRLKRLEESKGSPGPTAAPAEEAQGARPTIVDTSELDVEVDQALVAIAGDPELFGREDVLVYVARNTAAGAEPRITPIGPGYLLERLARDARWVRKVRDRKTGELIEAPTFPPKPVVSALLERGAWPGLRELRGVIEQPAMRLDGSIVDEPGFDVQSGLLFVPSADYPAVPPSPTRADAGEALARLVGPLVDFPFITPSDQSAALAAMLTLVGRDATAGPVPAFGVTSTVQGSGKGLLVDVVTIIGTGRTVHRDTVPTDGAEWKKALLSFALEGTRTILLDNVVGVLRSSALAAALTCREYRGRLLMFNRTGRAPWVATVFLTGNGLSYGSDLSRRVVPIRLDPRVEHPEDRRGFVHADLLEHVASKRAELLTACLIVLRAYHLAGRPAHDLPAKGSFEAWDRLVRGALLWLGEPDPLAGVAELRATGDPDVEELRCAAAAWRAAFGEAGATVAEALDLPAAPHGEELREALASLVGVPRPRLEARKVGYALRRSRGRIVDGLRFERVGEHRISGARWAVLDSEQRVMEQDAGHGSGSLEVDDPHGFNERTPDLFRSGSCG